MTHLALRDIGGARPTVLTVGFFDGVHLGHRAVVNRVTAAARRRNSRSAVVTFEPHPRTVLTGHTIPLLSTLDEKSDLLLTAGIDLVVVVPFDRMLSESTAGEFVSDILVDHIGAIHIVVGYDHSIGKGGAGNASTITQLGRDLGFTTEIILPQSGPLGAYSSSQIRGSLQHRGDVSLAASQLGRLYNLTGTVVHGDGRGKELGFPTANLELPEPAKAVPANGVYAVQVIRQGTTAEYDGIMNIGVRPTLTSGSVRVLEVHLL
ncbi:MAG: riboflavin biosynthesis protein RibF, partial [Rhodothermia bacterium]